MEPIFFLLEMALPCLLLEREQNLAFCPLEWVPALSLELEAAFSPLKLVPTFFPLELTSTFFPLKRRHYFYPLVLEPAFFPLELAHAFIIR
jgi:hypothetical protein